jgi:hypothetical protein
VAVRQARHQIAAACVDNLRPVGHVDLRGRSDGGNAIALDDHGGVLDDRRAVRVHDGAPDERRGLRRGGEHGESEKKKSE